MGKVLPPTEAAGTLGESAFSGCSSLECIDIPPSVETIDCEAFCNCTNVTSIRLPASVDLIFGAIVGCDELTTLVIYGRGYGLFLEDIDFAWFDNLKEIIVPYRKKNYYIELLGWGEDIVVERKPQKKTKNDESK